MIIISPRKNTGNGQQFAWKKWCLLHAGNDGIPFAACALQQAANPMLEAREQVFPWKESFPAKEEQRESAPTLHLKQNAFPWSAFLHAVAGSLLFDWTGTYLSHFNDPQK